MTYFEFPFDRILSLHVKPPDEPPPPPPTDDTCFAGTWEFTQNDSGSVLEIHDVLTVPLNGVSGDRTFTSPPEFFNFFRVLINSVEFGPPDITFDPKDLFGSGLNRRDSKLLIQGSSTRGDEAPPPSGPPFPKIPMFNITAGTDTLSFSRMSSGFTMPDFPPGPFMTRGSSWEYLYDMNAPYTGSYPNFDPDAGGGIGVFYLTNEGGSITNTSEWDAWYNYHFLGIGSDPGTLGDQFYNNSALVGGTFYLKLTQICGPITP